MKKQSNNFLQTLTNATVTKLTTQIKEILATDYKKEEVMKFSTVDLWNIQRRRKAKLARRYF